jgi:phosphatidylserine/phosphatidylglycerophosphate/cardiolipin synthase-like enzyme
MADGGALEAAIVSAARTLPADQVAQLASALARSDGPTAPTRARAGSLVATDVFVEAVSEIMDAWLLAHDGVSGAGVALGLRSAALVAAREREDEKVEIVWSGPATAAVPLRRTRAVLFELVASASSTLTLISYAAFRQDDLVGALQAAVGKGVRVRLVLESAAASRGRLDDDAARAFASLGGLVDVLEWPAELRGEGRGAGVLHAKAVIADSRSALVSSANLTAAALDRNMELGLLVTGGGIPRRLEEHFAELRTKGILRPVQPE